MKRYLPAILSVAFVLAIAASIYQRQTPKTEFDLDLFGATPVLFNGRVQPLDSVARNSLLLMNGKRTAKWEGEKHRAIEWLAEAMMTPGDAAERPVFRIYDEGVRAYLPAKEASEPTSMIRAMFSGKGSGHFYYSFEELSPFFERIRRDADTASKVDAEVRSRYQKAVIDLTNAMVRYIQLNFSLHHGSTPRVTEELERLAEVMPAGLEAMNQRERGEEFDEGDFNEMMSFGAAYQSFEANSLFFTHPRIDDEGELTWNKPSHVLNEINRSGAPSPVSLQYARLIDAYRFGDHQAFNQAVAELHAALADISPEAFGKSQAEREFNYLDPFTVSMVSYILAFLLVTFSWVRWFEPLSRAAYWTLFASFLIHTAGIAFRVYIIDYAPVINLYSSAVFVGWIAVLLSLFLEPIFRNGIPTFVAGLVGFATLIVAANLGDDGDTLEMMRAVLDSNFWLTTHVLTITAGYGSTYLAGAIAFVFIILGLTTNLLSKDVQKTMRSMVYGIVCFSTLFSFVGTILGGIWADQSWGRFWGWDPKENGAVLLVLWNTIILHARWGGLIRTRGLMMMAIFGNVVTSWSWMGTNMLGIGLHSYGFTSEAFFYLSAFGLSQFLVIALAFLPQSIWRSPIKV